VALEKGVHGNPDRTRTVKIVGSRGELGPRRSLGSTYCTWNTALGLMLPTVTAEVTERVTEGGGFDHVRRLPSISSIPSQSHGLSGREVSRSSSTSYIMYHLVSFSTPCGNVACSSNAMLSSVTVIVTLVVGVRKTQNGPQV
jgi:hypothetical protein